MKIDQILLTKYFSGLCTPEEEAQVLEYLAAEDSDTTPLENLLEEEKAHVVPQDVPSTVLKTLIYRIRKEAYPEFLRPVKPVRQSWWYAVAAAAVLLPVIWFAGVIIRKPVDPAATITAEAWKTVVNKKGSTQIATLPDGSRIWLGSKSSLSYLPGQYGARKRTVRLEGEAFFDVAHDPAHPFVVQHGPISTHVLGTAFNVEAYPEEKGIRISLVRGKVAVNRTSDTTFRQPLQYLRPGQQLVYDHASGKMAVRSLLYNDEALWTNGWMVLEDVPLADALQRLERLYGSKIVVPSDVKLDNRKVTAVIKGGTLEDKLHNMLFAHHLRYEKKNEVFYIQKSN